GDVYGYNDRSELTGSERFDDTSKPPASNPDHDLDRAFDYDTIGNRESSLEGDDPQNDTVYYCSNNVNQYDATAAAVGCSSPTESFEYDAVIERIKTGQRWAR
ncbi:MAG: hypothetical protein GY851_02505, partial [bacterium]|nr:hypothetical protein [bacterium]